MLKAYDLPVSHIVYGSQQVGSALIPPQVELDQGVGAKLEQTDPVPTGVDVYLM